MTGRARRTHQTCCRDAFVTATGFFPSWKWSLEVFQNSNQIQGCMTNLLWDIKRWRYRMIYVWLTFHMDQWSGCVRKKMLKAANKYEFRNQLRDKWISDIGLGQHWKDGIFAICYLHGSCRSDTVDLTTDFLDSSALWTQELWVPKMLGAQKRPDCDSLLSHDSQRLQHCAASVENHEIRSELQAGLFCDENSMGTQSSWVKSDRCPETAG